MDQYNYLKATLEIDQLPDYRNSNSGKILNSEILLFLIVAFTVATLLGYMYPLAVFVLGIALPLWCWYEGIDMRNFYPWLSLLLWFRLWCHTFLFLDASVIVCLWHPNINWAKRMNDYVVSAVYKYKNRKVE